MLNSQVANDVICEALSQGADFAELFIEHGQASNLRWLGEKVHETNRGIDFGIGVRLIFGTKVVYGYTNIPEKNELIKIVQVLSAQENIKGTRKEVSFEKLDHQSQHQFIQGLDKDIEVGEKINFLKSVSDSCRQVSDKISQVDLSILQKLQQIEIYNSKGLHATDERHYTRLYGQCIATDGSESSTGSHAPGALQGWSFIKSIDPKLVGEDIARQALIKLDADPCPAGTMPVIIDKGFGGVIFHEACGHLLETTSVAKKASVFHDKLDQKIAHNAVSAVDDGTITNEWGSISIDDEGMQTQKTQLIKDGVLESFMVDYVGSLKTGYDRTGSGRRQSYKFAPTSRMRNTYIESGDYSFDDLIASVDHGIYCKSMGGGSVKPGTGEFNFSAQESYLIKDGKIDRPLKSATLIGTGPDVLTKISMVGKEMELAAGMCGSVSGSVPVTVGQAPLRVDEILVGGDAT